jgi:hypothetical protein
MVGDVRYLPGLGSHLQKSSVPSASGERRTRPRWIARWERRMLSAARKRSPRFASPEKSQPEQTISAFPSRTPVEGTRPILSCAAGACDEVPREERGAWLRGAAPASATSP